jgi:6-phosphogluconolactonase
MKPLIHVHDTPEQLYRAVADAIIGIGNAAINASGKFSLVLSGGSTPQGVYQLLAEPPYRDQLPWNAVHLFWGDERCVIKTHPDSNYRMAYEAMISKISIPPDNVHRVQAEEDALLAAQAAEDEIRDFFEIDDAEFPEFDLVLLGLGDDGHTASIFPDTDATNENDRIVMDNFVRKLKTHRITMTLPAINHARNVFFLVSGPNKADICEQVVGIDGDLPAQRVRPVSGQLTWYLDRAAAQKLKA